MEAEPNTVPSLGFRWPSGGKIPKKSSQIPNVFALKIYKICIIMSLKLTNHTWKIDASKFEVFFCWDGLFSAKNLLVSGRVNVSNQSMVHLPNLEAWIAESPFSKRITVKTKDMEGNESRRMRELWFHLSCTAKTQQDAWPYDCYLKEIPHKKIHHSLFHPLFLLYSSIYQNEIRDIEGWHWIVDFCVKK